MAQHVSLVMVALCGSAALLGCANEQCERGRLQVASTWEEVRDTAASLKNPRDFDVVDARTKQARLEAWSSIAEKAETVRSSFETTTVTWNAATKARDELVTVYNKADPTVKQGLTARGFGDLVAHADERTGAFEAQCK